MNSRRSCSCTACADTTCAAGAQTPDSQLEASRSALERKAELYERLAAGRDDDDDDLYNVDFVRKEPRAEAAAATQDGYGAPRRDCDDDRGLYSGRGGGLARDTAADALEADGACSVAACQRRLCHSRQYHSCYIDGIITILPLSITHHIPACSQRKT